MMDEDEEQDDPSWTIHHLFEGNSDPENVPNIPTLARLAKDYHTLWTNDSVTQPQLLQWVLGKFGMTLASLSWDAFHENLRQEWFRLLRLQIFSQQVHFADTVFVERLHDSARVLQGIAEFVAHTARVFNHVNTRDTERRKFLPEGLRTEAGYSLDVQNILMNDEMSNSSFQNVFLYLMSILQPLDLRRANGWLCERVVTKSGHSTMAFQPKMEVATFVAHHTAYHVNFRVWKWITQPMSNVVGVVEYMTKQPLPCCPDVQENHHLRSYEGDCVGRGAGVYDSRSDMFFEYATESHWEGIAAATQSIRRRVWQEPEYVCEAPKRSDVCIVHVDCAFPYDIYSETRALENEEINLPWCRWRLAEEWECRVVQDDVTDELDGDLLDSALAQLGAAPQMPPVVGTSWMFVRQDSIPPEWKCADLPSDLCEALRDGVDVFERGRVDHLRLDVKSYFALDPDDPSQGFYTPKLEPAWRARAHVSCPPVAALQHRSQKHCFAKRGDQYLKPHVGREWFDCDSEEIEQIYACQKFTEHDRFFLYAGKGRLFYHVGEMDSHEATLIYVGVGGCGKSTEMKVIQSFWPSHHRGILSSNIEPLFGMSQVITAEVIFCNEVSADLNVKQEEWQTSTSLEEGSYAVKNQKPMRCVCKGQHFWVGNSYPKKFNNKQGQVSRRLLGVYMKHQVKPRDGGISKRIFEKRGALQRKQNLAYHKFVHLTGDVDPLSVPETLPPAFAHFYRASRRETDPVEEFLSDGAYVKQAEGEAMTMAEFKELFTQYRIKNDMGRAPRWEEELWRNAFNDRGALVQRYETYRLNGEELANVDIIVGLCPVRRGD
tara:strand:- start:338 stop:2824 length:2487 start_codon:yes stop_codon:yes gene_type:complete